MMNTQEFCNIIKTRSIENKKAVDLLFHQRLFGQVMSIVRQELDSMVRCIYLLETDLNQRQILMAQTINGERWRNSQNRIITDRDMVNLSAQLWGWTKSVYDLGCAFIHLSNFHDYSNTNPFENLDSEEKNNIITHLNNYHGYPMTQELTFGSVSPYLSRVFEKVSSNLTCYVERLENEEINAD